MGNWKTYTSAVSGVTIYIPRQGESPSDRMDLYESSLKTLADACMGGTGGAFTIRTITEDDDVVATDDLVIIDASGENVTATLPAAASYSGFRFYFLASDVSNTVTIDGNGAETINGSANFTIDTQWGCFILVSDGTEWWIMSNDPLSASGGGGGTLRVEEVAADQAMSADIDFVLIDSTAGNVTITLPAAASSANRTIYFKKKVAANSMILDGNAAETIDGAATQTANDQYAVIGVVCDGTEWWII